MFCHFIRQVQFKLIPFTLPFLFALKRFFGDLYSKLSWYRRLLPGNETSSTIESRHWLTINKYNIKNNKKIWLTIVPASIFLMMMMMMMMIMKNWFCGMVDRRKVLSLISSRNHCQRSSPSPISDTSRVGLEPVKIMSSGFVGWSCAVVITTTPWRHYTWFLGTSSLLISAEEFVGLVVLDTTK